MPALTRQLEEQTSRRHTMFVKPKRAGWYLGGSLANSPTSEKFCLFQYWYPKNLTCHRYEFDFPSLTPEEEGQLAEKKRDEKKAARARKKVQDAAKKVKEQEKKLLEEKALKKEMRVQDIRHAEKARVAKLSSMTDREKRAEALERRLKALSGEGVESCDACGTPLVRAPFERLEFKYCTTACLRSHRDSLVS